MRLNKNRVFTLVAFVILLIGLMPMTVLATHTPEGNVAATVTPASISLTVTLGNLGYGILNTHDTLKEPTGQDCSTTTVGQAFTVTNNGTGNEDFDIKGAASTPGTWTLAGSAGADAYVHRFATDSTTCTFTDLLTTDLQLAASVASTSSVGVYLQLDMPTSTGNTDEQTLPITVTATAS